MANRNRDNGNIRHQLDSQQEDQSMIKEGVKFFLTIMLYYLMFTCVVEWTGLLEYTEFMDNDIFATLYHTVKTAFVAFGYWFLKILE